VCVCVLSVLSVLSVLVCIHARCMLLNPCVCPSAKILIASPGTDTE
jgi:hypothetical protein